MRKHLAVGVLSIALITPVFASTWNFLWVGNDEARFFFDADTVQKTPDKSVLIWIKMVNTTKPDADGSWATAARWKIGCPRRTIQTLSTSTYGSDGKFIRSASVPGAETEVVPDSTGEAMLKIACEPNFPNDKSGNNYFKLDGLDVYQATKNYVNYRKSQQDAAPK